MGLFLSFHFLGLYARYAFSTLNLAWPLIGNLIQNASLEWIVCNHNCSLDQRGLISVYLLSSWFLVVLLDMRSIMVSYILPSKMFLNKKDFPNFEQDYSCFKKAVNVGVKSFMKRDLTCNHHYTSYD
jgi:hypothetical protein